MIVVRLKGGLGNQMFQYALGRALALKHNVPLRFNIESYENTTARPFTNYTIRTYDLELFNCEGALATRKDIPWLYRMYGKGKLALIFDAVRRRIFRHKAQELYFSDYNPAMLDLGPNAYLDGFWQSPKYFNHIADIIRNDFTLKHDPSPEIMALAKKIKAEASVGIFIRRTDFIGNPDYEFVDEKYYLRGLQYIAAREKIETVYVFSDDIEWCRENVSFSHKTVFIDNTYAGERYTGKLFLMTTCRHFIIPNSTFAWWGAWLSYTPGKIVIAPNYWFPGTDIKDVIPSEWVIM